MSRPNRQGTAQRCLAGRCGAGCAKGLSPRPAPAMRTDLGSIGEVHAGCLGGGMAGSTRRVGLQVCVAFYPSRLLPTDQTTAAARARLGGADGADLSIEMSACKCIRGFARSRARRTEPGHPLFVGWTAWNSLLSWEHCSPWPCWERFTVVPWGQWTGHSGQYKFDVDDLC